MKLLMIAIFGSLGSLGRYYLSFLNSYIPYGTFLANFLGCMLLGYLIYGPLNKIKDPALQQGLKFGLLGALTTFSTFIYEIHNFWNRGQWLITFGYLFLSILVSFLGLFLSMKIWTP